MGSYIIIYFDAQIPYDLTNTAPSRSSLLLCLFDMFCYLLRTSRFSHPKLVEKHSGSGLSFMFPILALELAIALRISASG